MKVESYFQRKIRKNINLLSAEFAYSTVIVRHLRKAVSVRTTTLICSVEKKIEK